MKRILLLLLVLCAATQCRKSPASQLERIVIDSVEVNGISIANNTTIGDVDYKKVVIRISFSEPVDTSAFKAGSISLTGHSEVSYSRKFEKNSLALLIVPSDELLPVSRYRFYFNFGKNLGGIIYDSYTAFFSTRPDTTPKFPKISDDSLLTLVQKKTFSYFWDYAHPVSGLARERLGSGDVVTTGGSGFGIMAILTGIRRGFIQRNEGFERVRKIVYFLCKPSTDRFHGAYPHWMNGSTGKVIPFSQNDNGGDLVETALLVEGLLTARAYFRDGNPEEVAVCDSITRIWRNVEWDWYRQGGQNILYWHWSPDLGWKMNMGIRGWNEALIVYVLAASSPDHSIPAEVYLNGWARNGAIRNNKSFYGITLPLGEDYGGPLFFAHYSFIGLDPRNLSDQFASYLTQNVSHALINRAYCIANPKGYTGYGGQCWGLTASDIQNGYSASSPTNDLGVIAPTAALSSFPYTPSESLTALHFFYYTLGDRIWGEYGFHDAFNLSTGWFADSYISIDEGPIICMIENYRSGFLWNLFMSDTDVQNGLRKLGFSF
jgi:hypothetical protein